MSWVQTSGFFCLYLLASQPCSNISSTSSFLGKRSLSISWKGVGTVASTKFTKEKMCSLRTQWLKGPGYSLSEDALFKREKSEDSHS